MVSGRLALGYPRVAAVTPTGGRAGRVADRAVQIHGGAGYIRGVAVERFYRDARLFRIYEGTSQIQQVITARRSR